MFICVHLRLRSGRDKLSRNRNRPYTLINVGPIWRNRAIAGIDIAANIDKYWYHGDFNKAFWWMENWPLTPWMASADEYVLKDRGLVAAYGANYRGVGYPREPRYVVRNRN